MAGREGQRESDTPTSSGSVQLIRQLDVDCYDCDGPLNDPAALLAALRAGAEAVGATVLDTHACTYQPHGVTAVAFLLESHVIVTTWPEHGYAVVEAFLCNPQMDPMVVWERVAACLRPRRIELSRTPHRVPVGTDTPGREGESQAASSSSQPRRPSAT